MLRWPSYLPMTKSPANPHFFFHIIFWKSLNFFFEKWFVIFIHFGKNFQIWITSRREQIWDYNLIFAVQWRNYGFLYPGLPSPLPAISALRKILKNAILILPAKIYKNFTPFDTIHWQNSNFEIASCVEWQVSFLPLKIINSKNLIFPKKKKINWQK